MDVNFRIRLQAFRVFRLGMLSETVEVQARGFGRMKLAEGLNFFLQRHACQ
jgi:hypothetical protein